MKHQHPKLADAPSWGGHEDGSTAIFQISFNSNLSTWGRCIRMTVQCHFHQHIQWRHVQWGLCMWMIAQSFPTNILQHILLSSGMWMMALCVIFHQHIALWHPSRVRQMDDRAQHYFAPTLTTHNPSEAGVRTVTQNTISTNVLNSVTFTGGRHEDS